MATWIEPKTDWEATDYFNAEDYNRIKNNLEYLYVMAQAMYPSFLIVSGGNDKNIGDFFYADEINILEDNLESINVNTLQEDYGTTLSFNDNDHVLDYVELNRLESACVDLHNKYINERLGQRHFTWHFGIPEIWNGAILKEEESKRQFVMKFGISGIGIGGYF